MRKETSLSRPRTWPFDVPSIVEEWKNRQKMTRSQYGLEQAKNRQVFRQISLDGWLVAVLVLAPVIDFADCLHKAFLTRETNGAVVVF